MKHTLNNDPNLAIHSTQEVPRLPKHQAAMLCHQALVNANHIGRPSYLLVSLPLFLSMADDQGDDPNGFIAYRHATGSNIGLMIGEWLEPEEVRPLFAPPLAFLRWKGGQEVEETEGVEEGLTEEASELRKLVIIGKQGVLPCSLTRRPSRSSALSRSTSRTTASSVRAGSPRSASPSTIRATSTTAPSRSRTAPGGGGATRLGRRSSSRRATTRRSTRRWGATGSTPGYRALASWVRRYAAPRR